MRIPWFSLVIVGAATLTASGCATGPPCCALESPCAAAPVEASTAEAPMAEAPTADRVVFVADGAGNFQMASIHLRATVLDDAVPLQVLTFDWSHGYRRVIADQIGLGWARGQGHRLACEVQQYHDAHPEVRIYLLGHSAGAVVVLAAMEEMPPGVVEGVVLLSPSVSHRYDLRPALACVAGTIDVFYSPRDSIYLGWATWVVGTADRTRQAAAGRIGFRTFICDPDDALLYSKLRQYCWQPQDQALGHNGGHYGGYQPEFLRERVLPSFFSSGE